MPPAATDPIAAFIALWGRVEAPERATSQSFLNELCVVLGVAPPDHSDGYRFERPVPVTQAEGKQTTKSIDLYKRGCFILESKKFAAPKGEPGEFAGLFADT